MGLSYTAHYDDDFAGFETDLAAGGWDLVLFGNDTYWPESSTLDALNAYAAGGGRVIVNSWVMADYPGHALWTTLGATWVADDDDPPRLLVAARPSLLQRAQRRARIHVADR